MELLSITISPVVYFTLLGLYLPLLGVTLIRILLDTHSSSKTLAYILLVFVLPLFGIIFYYAFGINYRHRVMTLKSGNEYNRIVKEFKGNIPDETEKLLNENFEVIILNFSPTNPFINVDLPAFGLPTIFTKPDLCVILSLFGFDRALPILLLFLLLAYPRAMKCNG